MTSALPDRLPEPLPDWMTAQPTRRLMAALTAGGATVRFVGGCVRDALLGLAPADVDLATPELPDVVMRRLGSAGLKAVPTGIEHGTVTAVVPPSVFQITTLRRDVATDGRHAEVAFVTDGSEDSWAQDARRRDFTINALYADADGRLHDFTNGRADLDAGIVRFIGDPAARVAEDYLRVLRFFRFHARFGRAAPDAASLAACAAAAGSLGRLSGERVRDELLKILALPNAAVALRLMQDCGVLGAVLPEAHFDPVPFSHLVDLQHQVSESGGIEPEVWPRLALMVRSGEGDVSTAVGERLKLSNAQRLRLDGLIAPLPLDWDEIRDGARFGQALYRFGAERCRDHVMLAALDDPSRQTLAMARVAEATAWRRPVFPVRGADLLALGFAPSPNISSLLKEIEAWWAADGFRADREACLQRVRVAEPAQEQEPDAQRAPGKS